MIRSMQRRLAVVVLLFLVAVYACLCAVSYGAAVSGMVRESEQMLRSLAEPDPPMGGRIFPGQVGVPYFTLLVDGRGVLEDADQGQFDISDEELLDLAAQVLTAEEDFGYLGSYQLRYYRVSIPGGWRLVFADDSLQEELRLRQVRNSLLLGLALLPVFLAFSWLLAGLIVRPVRRAWEQQAQFVADASHELKTPLTVILSNTEMILADCPQEDPALQRRAGYIRREADRMRGLVLDMLELVRSDAQVPSRRELAAVDFSAVVATETLAFEAVAYEAGLALTTEAAEGVVVRADGKQAAQVLHILLDNAVKYSLPGGTVSVSLAVDRGRYALLSVSNPSEPISEKQLERIFDRFYRLDSSRSLLPGYGLGLPVARELVDRWGGKVWAEHRAGATRFLVRLPLAKEK